MNFLLAIATIFLVPAYQLLSYGAPVRVIPAAPPSNHRFSCDISPGQSDSPINQIRQMRQQQSVRRHHHHQEQVPQQQPHSVHDSIYQKQLFSLERELVAKTCHTQHQRKRLEALRATQRKADRAARAIHIEDNVRFFAQQYDISPAALIGGVLNAYEYQLHSEFLEQLSQAAQLKCLYNDARDYRLFIDAVGYGVSCGIDSNNNHQAIQATQWADFGWQVLDLAKAALEGAVLGVYNTAAFAANVVAHPLETIKTVVYGAATITSFLARATGAILRMQALEEHGHHEQLHAELDELADQINVVINHCSECLASMPLREKVKHVVAFGTEIMVPIKVFKVAHTLCSRMRPMVVTMLNILRDEQVGIEIAGVGENILVRGGEEIQKISNSVTAIMSDAQPALVCFHTNLMKKLEPEIAALRTFFDNKLKGFGEFSNKYLKIDYDHILGMDLSFNRKGVPILSGFHHDLMNAIENEGVIKFLNKHVTRYGSYRADVQLGEKVIRNKTFFPAYWQRDKVINAIYEAYDDFMQSGKIVEAGLDGKYEISGYTREGIEVVMFITKKGNIATAYPIIK